MVSDRSCIIAHETNMAETRLVQSTVGLFRWIHKPSSNELRWSFLECLDQLGDGWWEPWAAESLAWGWKGAKNLAWTYRQGLGNVWSRATTWGFLGYHSCCLGITPRITLLYNNDTRKNKSVNTLSASVVLTHHELSILRWAYYTPRLSNYAKISPHPTWISVGITYELFSCKTTMWTHGYQVLYISRLSSCLGGIFPKGYKKVPVISQSNTVMIPRQHDTDAESDIQ